MPKFFVAIISPLILLIDFWIFFYTQHGLAWLASLAILVIIVSGRFLARRYFWSAKILWLSLILVYLSQLLFLLLISSNAARYGLSFLIVVLWALVWLLLNRYFSSQTDLVNKEYLASMKFFYYLGFWFLASSLYSLIIFINLPLWWAAMALTIPSFFWSKEIIKTYSDSKYYVWLVVFLIIQLAAILYLLPVNFYVVGTILTLWFYFLVDNSIGGLRHFKLYLALFYFISLLLLVSAFIY